eukprot:CAMPEP_0176191852 /NCGR_PEP_ID=MMETSP0121_2-20121125/4670_1 /TAXON_ID=160619 /ORGANISM="Kryptoperidinium foliaceum, Strain CCMP 1326" /LENGTH=95 /DNA_ID=CAMNT_0017530523 /DNA_START=76 /DNA_END=364 /DNA_ORIENTATION=+
MRPRDGGARVSHGEGRPLPEKESESGLGHHRGVAERTLSLTPLPATVACTPRCKTERDSLLKRTPSADLGIRAAAEEWLASSDPARALELNGWID